ncbi:DUF3822 family protein [Arcticibacter eurypsychrophilus]|uniref:DUF3822 family protein n=1 Tax=Arcticibacter eurypsychrophilus TaxID=1434752 RepID=UPI00084CEF48|nr:DUF3822 family protein [Arcticibacter eurypsychrophilus]
MKCKNANSFQKTFSFAVMNNVGTLHLKDKNFLPENADVCELLIKLSQHKLSYAIRDIQTNQLFVIYDAVLSETPENTLVSLEAQHDYLNLKYKQVKISAETFNFVFIPTELYTEIAAPSYKNFVRTTKASRTLINKTVDGNMHTISSVDESLIAPLLNKYPDAAVYSQAEALIESISGPDKQTAGLLAIIQFNSGTVEIALLSEGQFIFYNIFKTDTVDDYNYYLLLVKQQFNLQPNTNILLAGEVEKYSELYRRTAKYFKNIKFADSTRIMKYPESFKLLPAHQFYSLLSMSLCE